MSAWQTDLLVRHWELFDGECVEIQLVVVVAHGVRLPRHLDVSLQREPVALR
jgi:hypothetical protein